MPKYFLYTLLVLLVFSHKTIAQFGFSHEIGIITGPVAFQSDYGERHDLKTNTGNTGIGIGIVHFMNFLYDSKTEQYTPKTYFNDHFKLRTELSYSKTNFDHYGKWVASDRKSLEADQLRAMKGSSQLTNIGIQLEYFPLNIYDFEIETANFSPFISLGAQFSSYNAKAYSTLGPLGTTLTTYPKFLTPTDDHLNGFSTESNTVWSIVSSVGTRYKLNPLQDLMVDLRFQYFFSDWVDGLNPNPEIYKENKANDWLVWLNFGYIYYLP
ncbi:THC0290_0291 family protein [Flavobacterium sp.]|uniref:THC0290_0291 family protein n=1 Tax=Flavobacterium sp. TaxID=239 RepID=UPI003C66A68C